MKYDIYFHNDFDGRASAAVVLAFLKSRGDSIEHFTAVNYDLTKQWMDEKFFAKHKLFKGTRNPAIIVDFLYHPAAAIWFDHHPTTFKREDWRPRYKKDAHHRLDPSYLSACHLTYTALRENFGWKPPAYFKELVKWLDIIDAAGYKTPKQVIFLEGIGLEVSAYVDMIEGDPRATQAFINLLAAKPLHEIVRMPKVQKAVRTARKENMKSLAFYKEKMKVIGDASLIDLTGTELDSLRFAPYYLNPKIVYAVRMTKKGRLYHVGVGINPWLKNAKRKNFREVHIGELMRKFGGGGHKNAGAGEFRTKKDVLNAVDKIVPQLNK